MYIVSINNLVRVKNVHDYLEGDKMLIVKDNALINASYNLDIVEQRIILLAIIEARESGNGINANDALTLHASSYMQNFEVEKHAAYKALKAAVKDLFSRQFSYHEISEKGNRIAMTSRWVSQIGYIEAEASIKLIFAPAVVPLITRLEEQFTSYQLVQVAKLSSKYAMRLYELLIAWRTTGKIYIDIQDLRNRLGLSATEYKAMGDFKKNVLELALTQINEYTDIFVKYEQKKKGKFIVGFSFSFKQKKQPMMKKQPIGRDEKTLDIFSKISDAQRHLFARKLAHDERIASEYSHLVGTGTHEDFAKILFEKLLDDDFFKIIYPILLEHGFKP